MRQRKGFVCEIRRESGGELDEIVVGYPAKPKEKQRGIFVHLERLDHNRFWMGIDLPGGKHMTVNLHSRANIKGIAEIEP